MATFTIHQAQTRLCELIRRAEAGEEIVIARGETPVIVLTKVDRDAVRAKRLAGLGSMAGRIAPIPDEALIGGMTDEELEEEFGSEFADLLPGQKKP